MRSECSLAVGMAVVHALGGWSYPAAATLFWACANRMVARPGAHCVHELEFFVKHVRVISAIQPCV